MKYLLDTNVCIYYLNGTYPALIHRIHKEGPTNVSVSIISVAELYFGAHRSKKTEANLHRLDLFFGEIPILPFSEECASHFGRMKATLVSSRKKISDFDIAIAATAKTQGYAIVSCDKDLSRIRGLVVSDWSK